MAFFYLVPVSAAWSNPPCSWTASASAPAPLANPVMTYNSNLGTPTAQGIAPPYPQLAAKIYDLLGIGDEYGWNFNTGQWT